MMSDQFLTVIYVIRWVSGLCVLTHLWILQVLIIMTIFISFINSCFIMVALQVLSLQVFVGDIPETTFFPSLTSENFLPLV